MADTQSSGVPAKGSPLTQRNLPSGTDLAHARLRSSPPGRCSYRDPHRQANVVSVLVLTVLPVAVYLRRIQVEEAALAEVLGDRYHAFAAGRARLVPWLY